MPEVLRELLRVHGDSLGVGLGALIGRREAVPEVSEPRSLPANLCGERLGLTRRGERFGHAAEPSLLRAHLGREAGPLLGIGRLPGREAPSEPVREPLP